jgi:hypothetical protein
MLVCYAFEHLSRWFLVGFGLACGLGSAWGFSQCAWPFGVVEAIWAVLLLIGGPASAWSQVYTPDTSARLVPT